MTSTAMHAVSNLKDEQDEHDRERAFWMLLRLCCLSKCLSKHPPYLLPCPDEYKTDPSSKAKQKASNFISKSAISLLDILRSVFWREAAKSLVSLIGMHGRRALCTIWNPQPSMLETHANFAKLVWYGSRPSESCCSLIPRVLRTAEPFEKETGQSQMDMFITSASIYLWPRLLQKDSTG